LLNLRAKILIWNGSLVKSTNYNKRLTADPNWHAS
jgi:hypothetical protein